MAARFVVTKDKAGEYRFKLLSGNNETIAVSEGYKQKSGALNGIEAVRKAAAVATVDDQSE